MRRNLSLALAAAFVMTLVLPSGAALASEPARPSVVRDATWFLGEPDGGSATASWRFGRSSDVPLYGDWDGDGVATPGVYRDGDWYLRNSNSGGAADISFYYGGRPDDVPVVGDWDGDGIDTVGVIRGGTWYLVNEFRGGSCRRVVHLRPRGATGRGRAAGRGLGR